MDIEFENIPMNERTDQKENETLFISLATGTKATKIKIL
jgi:hypothetical protein